MLNAFTASAGIFVRGLESLQVLLKKGSEHALARGLEPESMLAARLADDMNDLGIQLHWAAAGAKLGVDRLLGTAGKPPGETASTIAAHQAHLDATIAYLRAVDPKALEAGLERNIELPGRARGDAKTYRGDAFLTEFVIPSFYFHFTMAYAILRHQGVPLQKGDFLGA